MYQRASWWSSIRPKQRERGFVVERVEAPLELPVDRLGVGLVGGEDVVVRDLFGRALAHCVEAGLGEFEARAFERDVRMRHLDNDNDAGTAVRPNNPDLAQVVHHPYIAPS